MSKRPIPNLPVAGAANDPRRPLEVPVDAHPDAVKGDSPLLHPARRAQGAIWETYHKIQSAAAEVEDKRRLAAAAQHATTRALSVADNALATLQQSRETVEQKIRNTVCPPSRDEIAPEIRAHFKGTKSPFTELANLIKGA